jgi:hypothetical protein
MYTVQRFTKSLEFLTIVVVLLLRPVGLHDESAPSSVGATAA